MKVLLKRQPQIALASIASFVEAKNTKGSGERFVRKFRKFIEKYAISNAKYAPCNHPILASLGFQCLVFNKWILAFTIENNALIIHKIIHGSILK